MGFTGETYSIPCDKGGLNGNTNIDLVPPESMIEPTRNIVLDEGGRRKRGGTSHVNSSALSSAPIILGIYDFQLKDTTQFVMLGSNDGKIWKNYTETVQTGWTANKIPSFEIMNNTLFICNGYDLPVYWDGSAAAVTNFTEIPTDWAGSNHPSQFIKHGSGASERLWAIGCLGTVATGYSVYASLDGDPSDFTNATVINIVINSPDPGGIIGGVDFGDRLIVFSKNHGYIIDDTDATVANWGYYEAQWYGGVANWRLIARTPNDVACMSEDGEIYSITAAQSYGDYESASLTRPSFMHKWIRDNVDLTQIDKFHARYNPTKRAIYFFVVKNGYSQVNTALIYYLDREPKDAWIVHDNLSYASGYAAASSAMIRYAAGDYRLYTGDYSGFVWRMDTANRNDNSNGYYAGFKVPPLNMENPRQSKIFTTGRVVIKSQGDYNLYGKWWVDGSYQGTATISQAGGGSVFDTAVFDTDVWGGDEVIDSRFELGQEGKRIQLEIYNSNTDEDFFISNVLIDFVPIGAKP